MQNKMKKMKRKKRKKIHHNMIAKKLILCMFDELKLQGIK